MSQSKNKRQPPIPPSVIINNFLLRLVGTGQIAVLAVVAMLVVLIFRTPADQAVQVWTAMGKLLDRTSGLGYSLAVGVGGGWFIQHKWLRRKHEREYRALAPGRTAAQQKHFKNKLSSSRAEGSAQNES